MAKPRRRSALFACTGGLVLIVFFGAAIESGVHAQPPRMAPDLFDSLRPDKPSASNLKLRHTPEILEMLSAIVRGIDMGPGTAWFHPGTSRYGWDWLRGRSGVAKDAKLTRKDFSGPDAWFDRLDRNHDGVLTKADFDWSERTDYAKQAMPSEHWFRRIDANSNGRISRDEWQAWFTKAAKGKDYLTADDLREAFPLKPPEGPPSKTKRAVEPVSKEKAKPFLLILASGLMSGEIGSVHEGPNVGDPAPGFKLWTHDGKRQVRLSDYLGHKPVVLIFGSFT